jgi:hypothetical protein
MNRRKLLQLTGLSLAFTVTGCSGRQGEGPLTPQPEPDHQIAIENMRSEPVNMTVAVRREKTGKTVHNQTYTLQPDKTVTAYNTRQANPDGVEEFNVSVTVDGLADSFTMETDTCQGDILAQVTESDGIDWVWAEC